MPPALVEFPSPTMSFCPVKVCDPLFVLGDLPVVDAVFLVRFEGHLKPTFRLSCEFLVQLE